MSLSTELYQVNGIIDRQRATAMAKTFPMTAQVITTLQIYRMQLNSTAKLFFFSSVIFDLLFCRSNKKMEVEASGNYFATFTDYIKSSTTPVSMIAEKSR